MMSPYKKLNYESLTIYFKQHIIKKCFVIKNSKTITCDD